MDEGKFDLNSIRVAAPCHVPWDSMAGDERVRHCGSCELKVFNIAAMTTAEAHELITTRAGRLCVRLYRRADGTILTNDCPVGLRAYRKRITLLAGAALTTVLGLFSISFGQKASDKSTDASKVEIERITDRSKTNELRGLVLDPNGAVIPGAQTHPFTPRPKTIGTICFRWQLLLCRHTVWNVELIRKVAWIQGIQINEPGTKFQRADLFRRGLTGRQRIGHGRRRRQRRSAVDRRYLVWRHENLYQTPNRINSSQ